ncbi:EamA family transporter [Halobacterium wangiae]|uniref:EamA family transporter n=1 Tax=Halobacterium wangiae TaxID=2902623 RepID=UPI001E59F892|nr:EamA family transporter [Halobacterium wangiae]
MQTGLLLAVSAALLFGVYLFAAKRYFERYPAPTFVLLANLAGLAWYTPFGWATMPAAPLGEFDPATFTLLVGSSVATGFAVLAFFRALKLGDVSYVAPISKIVPVFVLPLEILLLDEHMTPLQVGGVVVLTVAIYVANYQSGALLDPFRRAVTTPAARLAVASAAIFGLVDVSKRLLMQELAVPPQVYVPVLLTTVAATMVPFALRAWPRGSPRGDLRKWVGVGVLVAGAQHLTAVAFQTLSASIASPLVNTQAVVAVVLGGVLLDEPRFRTRLLAAALVVGGVTLVSLP